MAATTRFAPSHEMRIQKLEENLSEVKAAHAELAANLKNLVVQVNDGVGRINDKIDSIVAPLSNTIQEHIHEDKELASKVDALKVAVDKIEDDRARAEGKMKALRAAVLAVITGASAIALKEAVTWFVKQ